MNYRSCLAALILAVLPAIAQETAQPPLPTSTLRIGSHAVTAEIADDDAKRSCGLMFRESLAPDSGMLFVMPYVGPAGFWMKNTKVPLSIAFMDSRGMIMEIHDMDPGSEKVIRSVFPRIAYALEMARGWFAKNTILPGEQVTGLPAPSRQVRDF